MQMLTPVKAALAALIVLSVLFLSVSQARSVEDAPKGWEVIERASRRSVVEFRIALNQRNTDKLEELFWQISDPQHPNYGRYMTKEEVLDLVAPSKEDHDRVVSWVQSHNGVVSVVSYGDALVVRADVATVERMLSARLFVVKELASGKHHIKLLGEYKIPNEVKRYIELIHGDMLLFISRPRSKLSPVISFNSNSKRDQPSGDMVIPLTIQNLYSIPAGLVISTNSSQCVAEYADDNSFSQDDMQSFVQGVGIQAANNITIMGPYQPSDPDSEATLDIQWITAIGANGTNFYWTLSGWVLEFSQDLFNDPSPPLVNSQSWATDERAEGQDYNSRVGKEYQKLALRGVTMLASSGDSGAVGKVPCTGHQNIFNPGFPGDSPYLISVGATMLVSGSSNGNLPPVCSGQGFTCASSGQEDPANMPDGAAGDGFSTGGGFSVYSPRPSYQAAAVKSYLGDATIPKPSSSSFNASNRGFPDVAANGYNILIYISGSWQVVGGTSASSPIMGGIIALLNDHLIKNKKAPLGFANPMLYQMAQEDPSTFLSIGDLSTNNMNGCPYGYVSNPKPTPNGWDPVTGLGTPNVSAMLNYLDSIMDRLPPLPYSLAHLAPSPPQ